MNLLRISGALYVILASQPRTRCGNHDGCGERTAACPAGAARCARWPLCSIEPRDIGTILIPVLSLSPFFAPPPGCMRPCIPHPHAPLLPPAGAPRTLATVRGRAWDGGRGPHHDGCGSLSLSRTLAYTPAALLAERPDDQAIVVESTPIRLPIAHHVFRRHLRGIPGVRLEPHRRDCPLMRRLTPLGAW